MKFKFYEYERCSTCVNARKWMEAKGIVYERIAIRKQPPQKKELEQLLHHHGGNVKKLFNTSGLDYRNMKIKDSLPYFTEEKALGLLHANGNLIKRPVLIGEEIVLQGFKSDVWEKAFGLNE